MNTRSACSSIRIEKRGKIRRDQRDNPLHTHPSIPHPQLSTPTPSTPPHTHLVHHELPHRIGAAHHHLLPRHDQLAGGAGATLATAGPGPPLVAPAGGRAVAERQAVQLRRRGERAAAHGGGGACVGGLLIHLCSSYEQGRMVDHEQGKAQRSYVERERGREGSISRRQKTHRA